MPSVYAGGQGRALFARFKPRHHPWWHALHRRGRVGLLWSTDRGARRGGRARLKASDSKSDRGVSPSGVQILSPPPNFLRTVRRVEARGEVTERPKVRHWKCRIRVTVSRVRIPAPPPVLSIWPGLTGGLR